MKLICFPQIIINWLYKPNFHFFKFFPAEKSISMTDLGSKSGITSRQFGSNFQSFLGSKFPRSSTILVSAAASAVGIGSSSGSSSGFVGSNSLSLITLKPIPLAEQGREMRADSIALNSQSYNIDSNSNHVSSSGEDEDRKVRIEEHSLNHEL